MQRGRRPSIHGVGRVVGTGTGRVVVTGWGLSLCAGGCWCHRHPSHGALVILNDSGAQRLGLRSFRAGGCTCCEPWTYLELAGVLKDLADIAALQGPAAPQTSA